MFLLLGPRRVLPATKTTDARLERFAELRDLLVDEPVLFHLLAAQWLLKPAARPEEQMTLRVCGQHPRH